MKRYLKRTAKVAVLIVMAGVASFALLCLLFPFPSGRVKEAQANGSAMILDRKGGLLAWRVDARESWRLPVQVGEVSEWLIKATVASEDKRFWSHCGVDPLAVLRASYQNVSGRRRVSGASTITMQNMRLIWPRRRTYSTKCIEAFRSIQLERMSTKDEILQLYLNLAPYGGNVVGAEAAARQYFGKGAAELSLGEAALLAGIPQRPARFNPRKHLDETLRRRRFVFDRMEKLGLATDIDIRKVEQNPIEISGFLHRTDAPRFADYIIDLCGDGGVLHTTLDSQLQSAVREAVDSHAGELRTMGIDGTAVVVLDVRTSELVAMVGSADPFDPKTGYVNCATARRQPGSLLKPFLYAAAFDSGQLTPQTVVYDVPTSWRTYRPENIDRRFLGPIPAARALSESRNLPAVRLLQRLGPSRLAQDVNSLDLKIDAAEERCGLTLALGTAEVRLVDIANAYAALARLGEYHPIRVLIGKDNSRSRRVYSAAAAYLTLRSLGASEPGEPFCPAWKTGTSWNHRDAWAVALTPKYVAAVWCGRLSGQGHPELVGARAALPLAFDIIERIRRNDWDSWSRPQGVRTRRVCALSGTPTSSACPHACDAEYIPGVSSDAPCSVHRLVRNNGQHRVVTVWPAEVANFLATRDASRAAPARRSIEILSPADGGEYILVSNGNAAGHVLEFAVQRPPDSSHIYWFLDGELLARTPAGEVVHWPMISGHHELIAADARGASRRVKFSVLPAGM